MLRALLRKLIVDLGAYGSIIAMVVTLKKPEDPFTPWQIVLATIFTIFAIWSSAIDIMEYRHGDRRKRLVGKRSIRNYMYEWISSAGTAAIFSRDLTWVDDKEMKAMLERKSANGELTIVLAKEVPLSRRLAKAGANVIYYDDFGYTIKSRFTIVNLNRIDSRVAIGKTVAGAHLVDEYSAEDGPILYMAQDLLEIMRRSRESGVRN